MKKSTILGMVFILGLMLFAFTACGGNDDVELTFSWWGGDFRAEQTHEVLDMFLAQTDSVDYIDRVVSAWGDYWDMLGVRAAAGDMPDIIQQDVSRMLEFTANDLLVDLTPYINDGTINTANIASTIIDAGRVPGRAGVYAIPIGMNVAAMVYNQTLLESVGLSAPRNMTLDQFMALSADVYRLTGVRTNWVSTDPSNPMEAHLRAQGVNLFEGNTLGGTWEHYVDYFEVIRRGMEEGWHIRPEDLAGRDGAAMNAMWYPPGAGNENLRTWNSLVWSNMVMGYINDSPEDMEVNMTTYPSRDPVRANFGRASMFLSITTHSDHPDEAAELVNYWLNNQSIHELMLGERGVIVNSQIAAAVYNDLSPGAQMQTEFVGWVNAGNSSPFNPTRPEGAPEVLAELLRITELVHFGQLTPEAAAQEFFTSGNAILG